MHRLPFRPNVSAVLFAVFAAAIIAIFFVRHANGSINGILKGQQIADERGCLQCHHPSGKNNHPKAPYIVGQKKKYMILQLKRFRQIQPAPSDMKRVAERHHSFMDKQSKSMTDSEITMVAEFFASFKCIPVGSANAKRLPAPVKAKQCAFCHGPTGVNPYAVYPNIAGQKEQYIIEQLSAFRESARHEGQGLVKDKRFHRMMSPSVIAVTDQEIKDLADYYSKQNCE